MGARGKTWAEKSKQATAGGALAWRKSPTSCPADRDGEGTRARLPGFKEGVWSRQTSEVIS